MKKKESIKPILRFFKGALFAACLGVTGGLILINTFGIGSVFDTYENILMNVAPLYYLYVGMEFIDRLHTTITHK